MWKVSVCVHECEGTQKNMACRTRHGAGGRGSAPRPHVAPRPARGGRPAAAAGGGACLSPSRRPARCRRRPAASVRPAARPAARRGVGEASGSAGDSRGEEALAGMPQEKGLYISYTLSARYGRTLPIACGGVKSAPAWTTPLLSISNGLGK